MKRNDFMDIIKGLSIFCVVIGHAAWEITTQAFAIPVGPFVYMFHLAAFFFCAGYLFKIDDEFQLGNYIVKRLKSLYLPFIKYSFAYVLIRNIFISLNVLEGVPYTLPDYIIVITNLLTFNGVGEFLAPFWFLPVMFWAMILFALIMSITHGLNKRIQTLLRLMLITLSGCIGLYTTERFFGLLYNIQIAYLMIPIVSLGYIFRKFESYISGYINAITTIIAFMILALVVHSNIGIIELSKFCIINHWVFYPVTIIGIWFCLGIGKGISQIVPLKNLCILAGRKSFQIMACHIACFKLIDLVYLSLFSTAISNLASFPRSFEHLWPLYILSGILFPLGIDWLLTKVYRTAKLRERIYMYVNKIKQK